MSDTSVFEPKSSAPSSLTVCCACAQDEFRRTPLYYAAAYGHRAAASLLIKSGARKNGLDREGWTALHAAARHGQSETLRSEPGRDRVGCVHRWGQGRSEAGRR